MKIFNWEVSKQKLKINPSFAAIGNFDGVHLGHIEVLNQAKKLSKKFNLPLTVLTFDPHPRNFFSKNTDFFLLQKLSDKTQSLEVIKNLFSKISFNEEKMIDSANKSNILATDFADYLANKKIPYREAYKIIKDISLNLKGKYIHELSLDELRQFSKLFEKDALDISLRNSIENRNSTGGTSTNSVRNQIIEAKNFLKKNKNAK